MAASLGGGGEKSRPRDGESCSLLVKNLPSQWFHSTENAKISLLKPNGGRVESVSCCAPENCSAIVRMNKDQDDVPSITYQGTSSSVVICEKTSTMITLSDSCFCDLMESTARSLNIRYNSKSEKNTYVCFGTLDNIVNFRNVLEKEILSSYGLDPRPHGETDDASVSAATIGLTAVPRSDVELLVDQVNPDVLLIMSTVKDGKIPGIEYDVSSGSVFIHKKLHNMKSVQERFYRFYKEVNGERIKSGIYHIPPIVPLSSVQDDLRFLLSKHDKCGIHVKKDTHEVRVASYSSRQYDSIAKHLTDLFNFPHFIFPNGRALSLLKKDITKEHVDIIVNPANGGLSHIGGLAAAINKVSNGEVQRYSDVCMQQYRQQSGYREIPVSEVAVTGAGGSLRCRNVIHAVGPTSKYHDCRGAMTTLIKRVLNEAEKLDAKSIAIPAISTGIFNVNKDLVATVIFSTILSYNFKKDRPVLDDIRIVIIDQSTYQSFLKHFNRIIEERNRSRVPQLTGSGAPHTDVSRETKPSSSGEIRRSESMPAGGKDDRLSDRTKGKHGKGGGAKGNERNDGSHSSTGSKTCKKKKNAREESPAKHDRYCNKSNGDGNNEERNPKETHDHNEDHGNDANKNCKHEEKEKDENSGIHGKTAFDDTSHTTGEKPSEDEGADISPEETSAAANNAVLSSSSSISLNTPKSDPSMNSSEPKGDPAVISSGNPVEKSYGDSPSMPSMSSPPVVGYDNQGGNPPSGLPQNPPPGLPQNPPPGLPQNPPPGFPQNPPPGVPQNPPPGVPQNPPGVPQNPPPGVPQNPPPGLPQSSNTGIRISNSPSGLDPKSPPFVARAQCSTCTGFINGGRKVFSCYHLYCDKCIRIMEAYYPCCPICLPALNKFNKVPGAAASAQEQLVGINNKDFILMKYILHPQYESDGTLMLAGREIDTLLPHTEEGKEVCMLFKQAFSKGLTFYYGYSSGSTRMVFTHSHLKFFHDGGGKWGYPDPEYLKTVKSFLQWSLLE